MADTGPAAQKLHQALTALQRSDMAGAGAAAAAALEGFSVGGDPTGAAAAHQVLAMVATAEGEVKKALAHVDAAIPLRQGTGDLEGLAALWQERFELCLREGDLDGARWSIEQQLAGHDAAGDREGAAHARHQLAQVLLQQGEDARAEELVQEALFNLQGPQGARGRSALQLLYANIWVKRQNLERAMRHAREALQLAREARFRPGEIDALQEIGTLHAAAGEWPAARRALEEALVGRELLKDLEGRAVVLRELAGVEFGDGKVDAGFERLDYAVRSLRESGNFVGEVTMLQVVEAAADQHHRDDLAIRACQDMLAAAQRIGDDEAVAAAHFQLASRAAGAADLAMAREHFAQARQIQLKLGLPHEAAVALGMLGQVVVAMGDRAAGRKMLVESLEALNVLQSEAAETVRQVLHELDQEP